MFERLRERFHREPKKEAQPYEIVLGVPFKPYEAAKQFYWPAKGEKYAVIPENYFPHAIAMRRKALLYSALGYLDIVSEDPKAPFEALLRNRRIEEPFGDISFEEVFWGTNKSKVTKKPFIVRLGFVLDTPAQYARFLNSVVDIKLGTERYFLTWNSDESIVGQNMQQLEEGQQILVIEKGLINIKDLQAYTGGDEDIRQDPMVWLRKDLPSFKDIQFTFHRIDNWDYQTEPSGPETPLRERIPVLV